MKEKHIMYKAQNKNKTFISLFGVYFISLFLAEVSPENLSFAKTHDRKMFV